MQNIIKLQLHKTFGVLALVLLAVSPISTSADVGEDYGYGYGGYDTTSYSYGGYDNNYSYGSYDTPSYSYGGYDNYDYGGYSTPYYSYGSYDNYSYGGYDTPSYSYGSYDTPNYSYGGYDDFSYGGYDTPAYTYGSYDTPEYTYGGYDNYSYGGYDAQDYSYGGYDTPTYTYGGYDDYTYGGYDNQSTYGGYSNQSTAYTNFTDYEITHQIEYATPQTYSSYGYTPSYGGYSYGGYNGYNYGGYSNYTNRCSGNNCNTTVTQTSSINATCAGYPSSAKVGDSVTWSVNASGGNGNYTYSWGGAATGSSSSVSNTYSTTGTKTATVTVTSGGQSVTRTCNVYVSENPISVSCTANPSNASVNDTVTFTAHITGNASNPTYSWSGTDGISGSSSTITKSFSTTGTKTATVSVTSGGRTASANCSTNIEQNNSSFTGSCSVSPSDPNINDFVTWRAEASGGNGNYTYSWSGDVNDSGQVVQKRYGSSGTRSATVAISSNGQTIYRTCSVYVRDDYDYNDNVGGYCEAYPSNPGVNQTVTFRAYGNGGNGYYTYEWSGDVYGSGQTINRSFNTVGTKRATVRIYSNGDYVTRDCSVNVGGYYGSNINVYENPGSGSLTSGVFLSQIPYTGFSGGTKVTLFALGLFFWSAVIAWAILRKKARKEGISQRELIARFKKENLARKMNTNAAA